ncbi:MEDS: MEthanogen/methylotroph, DcmR Sensory domain [Desulfacinum hydrothermale DSM 13146]|uniref:MEDS: MEthanogen/methylotroph, DcmR Sensory domain n=1 Tax=Desulfacinum hydrothermale DSM 13146 TaxID=1121390 RepID=A0A1W1XGU5_9BACT|nr:MEDS domain-containing protein [Desulfacinum hydrothermale]SMC23002.1 MEDS: MEthanogen/methylotroph, DcmR Sensory domain [Desulfacinum hydrothermale DSM 13146]
METVEKDRDEIQLHPQHFCACYSGVKQRDALVRSFVGQGLRKGERILYLVADERDILESPLDQARTDGLPLPRRHQLATHWAPSIYIQDGAFDPDRVLSQLISFVHSSLQLGFEGVRMASDAAWLVEHPVGSHLVIDYESRLSRVIQNMPCTLLCLYPKRSLPRGLLSYVFLSHPYILCKDGPMFNPAYGAYEILIENPSADSAYTRLLKGLVPVHHWPEDRP